MSSPPTPTDLLRRVRGPQLVGRDHDLDELHREVDRVLSGSFRVVLVGGGAGIGKTRLVAELVARREGEATCLSARSYRWGSTTSFGPWVEALDRHLRHWPEEELRRLCGASSGDLAFLLKSVEAVAPVRGPEPRRARLLEALVDLLHRLSLKRPVLLVLDDVHLADTSSWEALRYLGRRLERFPIGILATARPEELARHPIAAEVLLGLGEDRLLRRLTLAPLTHPDVAQLVRGILRSERAASFRVPDALVSWLLERSRGHPLYIVSLLRALLDENADLAAPRLDELPETLRERVGLELEAFPPDDRRLLEILVVFDRRTPLRDVARADGRPREQVGEAMERLCRSGLVTEHESGADLRYEVAHPIVQDAIYQRIGGARRRSLHRLVARVLLESENPGAAVAHFARSAERGEEEAVDALCRAMRQAEARGLYQEALATLAALLDLLPPGDERWLRVLEAMDWEAEWVLGHLAEGDVDIAIAAMERIRPLVDRAGDPRAQGVVNLYLAAFLSIGAGRLEEAEQACRRAIEQFEVAGDRERVLLARNELAWIQGCAGDLGREAAVAGEVAGEAEASGHLRPAVHAAGTRGYALARMGRFEEGEESLRHSIELASAQDDTYRAAWGRNQLGVLLTLAGRLVEGRASVAAALDEDPTASDTGTLEYLAHTDWLGGRLATSVAWVEQSEVRRPMRGSRRRAWALAVAARAHTEMGEYGRARRRIDRARATYQGRQILEWTCWCDWAEGVLAWHNRDHGRALVAIDGVVAWLSRTGASAYEALPLVDLAEIAADGGDAARADVAARRLLAIASDVGGGLHPALAALGTAWSRFADGRHGAAASAAREALGSLSGSGYDLYAAAALEVEGRALLEIDRRRAVDVLEEASALCERCGAAWRRDRCLSLLARLGSRGRRAAAAVQGPESLTEREREIARLAAGGHTARETAERLFISTRTVESHLESIYAKLGVSSKRELVQRAGDLGL